MRMLELDIKTIHDLLSAISKDRLASMDDLTNHRKTLLSTSTLIAPI